MSQTQEGQDLDVGEAEVGDSEDPDLIDGYEEETSEEPFDAEPSMEQSMEPPMEQSMEPPIEQSMEPPVSEQMMEPEQQRASPFDNEFRTIATKPQPPQQQEEEGVLFPDASETRAKKVGYY
jgi:hypothetical protein